MKKLYDVCVMYWDSDKKKTYHASTDRYNIPYAIAKACKASIELYNNCSKGTFIVLVPNGTKPLEYKHLNKKKYQNDYSIFRRCVS